MKLAVVAAAMVACTDDADTVELGTLQTQGAPLAITIPATASTTSPFEVAITTYNGPFSESGCGAFEAERTDVALTDGGADILVFDRFSHHGGSCPAILLMFGHEATLTFDQPGTKRLRIHGRGQIIERTIEVTASLAETE